MLNGTVKVNNDLIKMIHFEFMHLKIDNRHLIKKYTSDFEWAVPKIDKITNVTEKLRIHMKQPSTIYNVQLNSNSIS